MKRVVIGVDPAGFANPTGIVALTVDDHVGDTAAKVDEYAKLAIPPGASIEEVARAERELRTDFNLTTAQASERLAVRVAVRLGHKLPTRPGPRRTLRLEYIERRPVPEEYPILVSHLLHLVEDPFSQWGGEPPPLVLDVTGGHGALADMCVQAGIQSVIRVKITGGDGMARAGREWHAAKVHLRQTLRAAFGRGDVAFARDLDGLAELFAELKAIESRLSPSGRESFELASDGDDSEDDGATGVHHGDLASACELAAWWALRCSIPTTQRYVYLRR